eukprot:g18323.t1
MQRPGPMVAVYLDDESINKLRREYPGADPGRLRKVVIQYNPSASERSLYERHFGGSATVKLTGEASSENRVALTASVSSAGDSVEPQSLSCAVDVTPGKQGGGPLGSTVLIEQIKRAGAITEESWEGQLPALSAHERDFPTEEGRFHKLDEPLNLKGSICRADWVEGTSGFCRTKTIKGRKREDGWKPRSCIICNQLEASPCRDIFVTFESLSEFLANYQLPEETESQSQGPTAESSSEASSETSSAKDHGRGASRTESRSESNNAAEKSSLGGDSESYSGEEKGKREQVKSPQENGKDSGKGEGEEPKNEETNEEKLRREELKALKGRHAGIMSMMIECWNFYHVGNDASADDGVVPNRPDKEVKGGGDATSGKGSGAGKGQSSHNSGVATEEKRAGEGEKAENSHR